MKKVSRSFLFVFFAVVGILLAACNGQLPAGAEVKVSENGNSATVEFSGTAEAIAADQWKVSGQVVLVNAQTAIEGSFAVGDTVKVNATVDGNGTVTANKIESPNAANNPESTPGPEIQGANANNELTGKVESIAPDAWMVDGQSFLINTQTEIKGNILLGDVVKVHFVSNADGTFTATEIAKAGDNQANNALGNGNNSGKVEFLGAVDAINVDSWTVAGKAFAVNAQTEIKGNISVGNMVKVHAFKAADGTLTASEIAKASASEVNDMLDIDDLKIYGVLEQINGDQYVISGQVVLVTPSTELDSGLVVGANVKAEVVVNADGTFTAIEIETDKPSQSQHGNSGSGSGNGGSGSGNTSTPQPTNSGNGNSVTSTPSPTDDDDDETVTPSPEPTEDHSVTPSPEPTDDD